MMLLGWAVIWLIFSVLTALAGSTPFTIMAIIVANIYLAAIHTVTAINKKEGR